MGIVRFVVRLAAIAVGIIAGCLIAYGVVLIVLLVVG